MYIYMYVYQYIRSLCSQYALTFTTVSLATAYSVHQRPKNGLAIMLMAGATATVVDYLYAYTVTCSDQVRKSNEYYQQQKLLEPPKVQQLPPFMAGRPDDNLPR